MNAPYLKKDKLGKEEVRKSNSVLTLTMTVSSGLIDRFEWKIVWRGDAATSAMALLTRCRCIHSISGWEVGGITELRINTINVKFATSEEY